VRPGAEPEPIPVHESGPDALLKAREFARQGLGPASAALFSSGVVEEELRAALEQGRSPQDAVLAIVFRRLSGDRDLADEFFRYFFGDLFATGSSLVDHRLRDLMETGELVDSVVRDLWADLEKVEFRTRGQFLAFLLRRMQWKRNDWLRTASRSKRGGGLRPGAGTDLEQIPDPSVPSPAMELERADDLVRLAKLSHRLPPDEQEMVRMRFLEGRTYGEIGERFGLAANSIKRRIEEAQERLRSQF
jgi:RNA polymerase sigma factor (sigma-70 family)